MTQNNIVVLGWPCNYRVLLGTGAYSFVYAVSNMHVAKVLDRMLSCWFEEEYEKYFKDLKNEHEIHQGLFRAGIQVPKPEGIFSIGLESKIRISHAVNKSLPASFYLQLYSMKIINFVKICIIAHYFSYAKLFHNCSMECITWFKSLNFNKTYCAQWDC